MATSIIKLKEALFVLLSHFCFSLNTSRVATAIQTPQSATPHTHRAPLGIGGTGKLCYNVNTEQYRWQHSESMAQKI